MIYIRSIAIVLTSLSIGNCSNSGVAGEIDADTFSYDLAEDISTDLQNDEDAYEVSSDSIEENLKYLCMDDSNCVLAKDYSSATGCCHCIAINSEFVTFDNCIVEIGTEYPPPEYDCYPCLGSLPCSCRPIIN